MKKKIIIAFITAIIAISLYIPLANATDSYLLDESLLSAAGTSESTGVYNATWGHTFEGNDQYLKTVSFKLSKDAGFTGSLTAGVAYFNETGDDHWTQLQNFSVTILTQSDLTTAFVWYDFSFGSTYLLSSGTTYIVFVRELTISGTHFHIRFYSGGSHSTQLCNDGDYIVEESVGSTCYPVKILTTDVESDPDAGYNPGGLSWTTTDEMLRNLTSFIVPILVILLPVLLLIVITRSTDKWIILIGLTIGTGLGYFFGLVPLWLVFLVVIGLIGMAYQSVRGGG